MSEKTLGQSRCFVEYKDDPVQQHNIRLMRDAGASWIDNLEKIKPQDRPMTQEEGRLFSLAQTTIEEAVMWSIKAICK